MPDTPTFVVNDRRKFTSEGELRHESSSGDTTQPSEGSSEQTVAISGVEDRGNAGPQLVSSAGPTGELADLPESSAFETSGAPAADDSREAPEDLAALDELSAEALPPGPTEEQNAEATRAYDATVDRLDTALRAADPGGERMPEMTFERLTQSLYTQALMLLGGAAQPGETPRVDILGARQTIDMLAVIAEKTKGNLTSDEDKLLESALFDLRMGFLEITQALARQAAQRQTAPGAPGSLHSGGLNPGAGPRIVR